MTETPRKPQRSARLVFTQAVLMLQAFAAFFAALVVYGLDRGGVVDASPGLIWGGGLGLTVALALASGVQKRPWGAWLGSVLQVPMIVAGLVEPAIAVIGVIFAALWVTALRLGGRIDRERAEWALAAAEGSDPALDTEATA